MGRSEKIRPFKWEFYGDSSCSSTLYDFEVVRNMLYGLNCFLFCFFYLTCISPLLILDFLCK